MPHNLAHAKEVRRVVMSSIWTAKFHFSSKAVQSHVETRYAAAFTPGITALNTAQSRTIIDV